MKSRKSASILSQSSSPLATPVPSRETLNPHLRLHLCHTRDPGLEVMDGSQDLSAAVTHSEACRGLPDPLPFQQI